MRLLSNNEVVIEQNDNYFVTLYAYVIGVSKISLDGNYRFNQQLLDTLYANADLTHVRVLSILRNGLIFKRKQCEEELKKLKGSLIKTPVISDELCINATMLREFDIAGLSIYELHTRLNAAFANNIVVQSLCDYFPDEQIIQDKLKLMLTLSTEKLRNLKASGYMRVNENLPFKCFQGIEMESYMPLFKNDNTFLSKLRSQYYRINTIVSAPKKLLKAYETEDNIAMLRAWVGTRQVKFIVDVENNMDCVILGIIKEFLDRYLTACPCKVFLCHHDVYGKQTDSQYPIDRCAALKKLYPNEIEIISKPRLVKMKSYMDVVLSAIAAEQFAKDSNSAIVIGSSDSDFFGLTSIIPVTNLCIAAQRDSLSPEYISTLNQIGIHFFAFRGESRERIKALANKFLNDVQLDFGDVLKQYAKTEKAPYDGIKREICIAINNQYKAVWDYAAGAVKFIPNSER